MKPLSRTEMKMLIYNKVKRGMSYDEACKQLTQELKELNKSHAFAKSSAKRVEDDLTSPLPHNLKLKKEVKNGKRLRRNILPS